MGAIISPFLGFEGEKLYTPANMPTSQTTFHLAECMQMPTHTAHTYIIYRGVLSLLYSRSEIPPTRYQPDQLQLALINLTNKRD